MKKSTQRVLALLSVAAVLFSLTTAFAAQPPIDHPNWTYIEDAECYCYVSGGTVYADGYVQGDSRVTKSQITLTIQRQSGSSWVNVTSDTNLEYDNYAELDLTASDFRRDLSRQSVCQGLVQFGYGKHDGYKQLTKELF